MKSSSRFLGLLAWSISVASLQGAAPVVSNVRAAQRAGTTLVEILYDVSDADGNSPLRVSFQVSADAGATWTVPVFTYQGAVGAGVLPGNNRAIVWNAGQDWNGQFTTQCRVRVIADDGTLPAVVPNLRLIPAGTFIMGSSYSDVEGYGDDVPLHAVTLSAFYMDTYEVTKAFWDYVKTNTTVNGYTYINAGSAYASNHPIRQIDWFDAVKWCNARSELERLTPCYYTDAALTTVYKTGEVSPYVKWAANGYRLPTEAEWEKAARGGLAGQHYPWPSAGGVYTDHANCTNANYYGCIGRTQPVGAYPPNNYGLFDMAGNVLEWCWDWYGPYSSTTQTDPLGPASGVYRVERGGCWAFTPLDSGCAVRICSVPAWVDTRIGFRCVRGL